MCVCIHSCSTKQTFLTDLTVIPARYSINKQNGWDLHIIDQLLIVVLSHNYHNKACLFIFI